MIPGSGRSAGEGIGYPLQYSWASLMAQTVKNLLTMPETPGSSPWVGKIPWIRKWQPTLVFLPGNPMDRGAWWVTVNGIVKSWHD